MSTRKKTTDDKTSADGCELRASAGSAPFATWVNPDKLICHPDGKLEMKDGSSVRAYLKSWMAHCNRKTPVSVTVMTRAHAENVNIPRCA